MQQFLNQLFALLQQALTAIFQLAITLYHWSFGKILALINAPWQNWSLLKQIFVAAALIAIAYLLYTAGRQLWEALVGLFRSVVNVATVLLTAAPWLVGAGALAFAADWVVNNFRF